MNNVQLINKKFHILQREKLLKDKDNFIFNEINKRIISSLEGINLSVQNFLEIGYSSKNIFNYINGRFKESNFSIIDISKKILDKTPHQEKIFMDHDNWDLKEKKYDLIISNLYLHMTNNFDLILKNINNSLNNNGFLISTIPATNFFYQIKECMFLADLDVYGGAHRRFVESPSIEKTISLLKKHNYKIPVFEIDTINLKYEKFSSLLKDIRYLGLSNTLYDRKKSFEHKNYFKKVEEFYWKKFSYKNQLQLNLEVLYITGWKDDTSLKKI
jgi:SAM-dependent methyltransferase